MLSHAGKMSGIFVLYRRTEHIIKVELQLSHQKLFMHLPQENTSVCLKTRSYSSN